MKEYPHLQEELAMRKIYMTLLEFNFRYDHQEKDTDMDWEKIVLVSRK